jgi:bacterioferritin-associated ferredoxin
MYVCSCHAVSDRTVRAAIASGAATVEEVTERCRAGGRCGSCWPTLDRLIDEHATLLGEPTRRLAVA